MYSGEYNVVDVTLSVYISTGRGFDSHRCQATFQPARRGYTLMIRATSKTFLLIISFAFDEI
jgi:hypothetical protein